MVVYVKQSRAQAELYRRFVEMRTCDAKIIAAYATIKNSLPPCLHPRKYASQSAEEAAQALWEMPRLQSRHAARGKSRLYAVFAVAGVFYFE